MHPDQSKADEDPLLQYSNGVTDLREKLARVVTNKQAVADSLSRAAAALRSIAAARKQE